MTEPAGEMRPPTEREQRRHAWTYRCWCGGIHTLGEAQQLDREEATDAS